jgi:cytoskeletal protein CcmA (bactofilin family)
MTTIGPTLIITGDVTSQEDITIHGKVVGKLQMQGGAVLIAPHAHVEAEAKGAKLTVHGNFSGDIAATERVELTNTAKVQGKIVSPAVVIQDGAVFNGSIEVERRTNTQLRATIAGRGQEASGAPTANAAARQEPIVTKVG